MFLTQWKHLYKTQQTATSLLVILEWYQKAKSVLCHIVFHEISQTTIDICILNRTNMVGITFLRFCWYCIIAPHIGVNPLQNSKTAVAFSS